MAHINAFEFALNIQKVCDNSALVVTYHTRILDNTIVKIRIVLTSNAFVDVFYNSDTGKCAYALIEDGARIFGADNAFIGWHIHPFGHPAQHKIISEISFGEFLNRIEQHYADK